MIYNKCVHCGVTIMSKLWKNGIRTCDDCATQTKLDGERL